LGGGLLVLAQQIISVQNHKIRKIIKKSSVGYFCNECNAHYSQLNWVKEDHPGINVNKFSVIDLRNMGDIFS